MSNRTYDILKKICQIGIPAVLTCVSTILGLLDVPTETIALVIGIGTALNTLLGTLLGVTSNAYNKAILAEEKELDNEG